MASRGRILIVDDEANARAALSEILREEGYTTETAADGFKALGKLEEFAPDVVLTDFKMPGLDGIGAHGEGAGRAEPGATFVVMTAFGTISSAVEAVKKGAVQLPHQAARFPGARRRGRARGGAGAPPPGELAAARAAARAQRVRPRRSATHPSMVKLLRLVEQVAPSRASVLILGETRHRQGAHRRGDPPRQPAREGAARAPQLRRAQPSRCSRASSSATSGARSPAPSRGARGASSRRRRHVFLDEVERDPARRRR